jgi:Outer membrane lipoprotein
MDDHSQPDAAGDSAQESSTSPAIKQIPVSTVTQQAPESVTPVMPGEATVMELTPPSASSQPYQPYAPYPQAPGQFPYASTPSAPLASGYPTYPGYAPYPPYPGVPSMPLGSTPGTPAYPSAPYSYPGYPTYSGYTAMPSAPLNTHIPNPYATIPLSQQRTPLAIQPKILTILGQPFSCLVSASIIGGALLVVALSFPVNATLARADWSDSAITAAIVAFVLASLTIIGTFVRVAVGRRVRSMLLLALAMTLGLSALGGVSLAISAPLHGTQAHVFELGNNWEAAIHEYTLAGESAPAAPDIARIHDEWGEQLLAHHSYLQATGHFSTVINTYYHSNSSLGRAYKDQFNTYHAWLQNNAADIPYYDMLGYFDQYRGSSYCDASCSAAIDAIQPQALYQYGTQLVDQSNYSLAILQFEAVQTRFPTSSYVSKAHIAAAQAYYQLGQQQLATSCASAVSAYQILVKNYADTPEGKKAKTDLAAPQDVTGYITGFPAGVVPMMLLSRSADPHNGNFSGEPDMPQGGATAP